MKDSVLVDATNATSLVRNRHADPAWILCADFCAVWLCLQADGPVGAESKRHPDLGDSTPYSEYMALFHASKRAVSTYQFIHELDNVCRSKGVPERFAHMIKEPLIIYGDNDVATGSGLERRTLPRSRHWLLKYHATRDYVRQKLIIPKRVPTHDNISDCLTKALELADWNNVGMRMKGYAPIWPYNRL